jgi:hypothetical protein
MPDLTPPSEQPLPRAAKDRIRAQLMTEQPRRSRFTPYVAAAAVVAVMAAGALLADGGGEEDTVAPGGTTDTTGNPDATDVPAPTITPTPTVKATPERGPCDEAVPLKDATLTATIGTTSLYESAGAWVVCDTFASQDGGVPTLLETHQQAAPYLPDRTTMAISMNFLGTGQSQYFAAGKAFDGVDVIEYTFPDGKTVRAKMAGGFWVMDYRPGDGPLAQGDLRGLDPVEVSVEGPSTGEGWTLEWGVDTCAQRNHGC